MSYRLSNENDPTIQVCLTSKTWHGILNLAEEFGWNPIGEILPGQWEAMDMDLSFLNLPGNGNSDHDESSLVVWEDALNLADALEKAFLAYEPVHVPASFFVFEPQKTGGAFGYHMANGGSQSEIKPSQSIHVEQGLRIQEDPGTEHQQSTKIHYVDAYPGLGAIRLVIELCQSGPFRVERFHRGQSRIYK